MFWEGNIDGKKVVVFSNVNSLSCMEIKEYTMGTMGMNLLWNEESKIFWLCHNKWLILTRNSV